MQRAPVVVTTVPELSPCIQTQPHSAPLSQAGDGAPKFFSIVDDKDSDCVIGARLVAAEKQLSPDPAIIQAKDRG